MFYISCSKLLTVYRCQTEVERCHAEAERCRAEAERCHAEAERCHAEAERYQAEAERVRKGRRLKDSKLGPPKKKLKKEDKPLYQVKLLI